MSEERDTDSDPDRHEDDDATRRARSRMVTDQIEARGVHDPGVLEALRRVPRHLFVPREYQDRAYADAALPIASGQTISQPYMVGLMTQALEVGPGDRVLEVGTGSGYQTAVLAALEVEVFTIERLAGLSLAARTRIGRLGLGRRVHFRVGDGSLGWPEGGPFDGIIVTCGAPDVPAHLRSDLAPGGRLIIPVGSPGTQELLRITREGAGERTERLCGCAFVPLIGAEGWPRPQSG